MTESQTYDRVGLLEAGEDDGFEKYRDRVPDDEALAEMEAGDVRELAGSIPLFGAGLESVSDADVDRLRRNLRKFRDGGIPIECHRCHYQWVYEARSLFSCQCAHCKTSTGVKTPGGVRLYKHYSGEDE